MNRKIMKRKKLIEIALSLAAVNTHMAQEKSTRNSQGGS